MTLVGGVEFCDPWMEIELSRAAFASLTLMHDVVETEDVDVERAMLILFAILREQTSSQ